MKKHIIDLQCKNSEMLRRAFAAIELRTKSGVKRFKYEGAWDGMSYKAASFIADTGEVEKIADEVEQEFGVKITV
jgi:hypothetical protein